MFPEATMKTALFTLMAASILISSPLPSSADTFRDQVIVSSDSSGVITIQGGENITSLVQFCPLEWKKGCPNNMVIRRKGSTFVLDSQGMEYHQNAFNFLDEEGRWLLIPNRGQVDVGENVRLDEENGYFVLEKLLKPGHGSE
jgi:hypothetical protein